MGQAIYEYFTGPNPRNPATPINRLLSVNNPGDDAILRAELGRGFGDDPLVGGNPGRPADRNPLYWDETVVPNQGNFHWTNHEDGLAFIDTPNLQIAGTEVHFITALFGVNANGTYDNLALLPVPNHDEFVFRWSYLQTISTPGSCTICGITSVLTQNLDLAAAGGGIVDLIGNGTGDIDIAALFGANPGGPVIDPPPPGSVPEPGSLMMLVAGLAGLGLTRKRSAFVKRTTHQ